MRPYLRKPDPTRIPAILSRATPVFTMFGFWTTPSNATVNNSPDGHTHISRSHKVILKERELLLWVTYNMWHQDNGCKTEETQRLGVHSHRPGDRKDHS